MTFMTAQRQACSHCGGLGVALRSCSCWQVKTCEPCYHKHHHLHHDCEHTKLSEAVVATHIVLCDPGAGLGIVDLHLTRTDGKKLRLVWPVNQDLELMAHPAGTYVSYDTGGVLVRESIADIEAMCAANKPPAIQGSGR